MCLCIHTKWDGVGQVIWPSPSVQVLHCFIRSCKVNDQSVFRDYQKVLCETAHHLGIIANCKIPSQRFVLRSKAHNAIRAVAGTLQKEFYIQ